MNPPLEVNEDQFSLQNYKSYQLQPVHVNIESPADQEQAVPPYPHSSQDDQPPAYEPPNETSNVSQPNSVDSVHGYNQKQAGLLWLACFAYGLYSLLLGSFTSDCNWDMIILGILLILWSSGIQWTQVQDKEDHLLLTWGPLRWILCGMGKEKIGYEDIKDYSITNTCFYGFGIPCCTGLKLFTTCSCGCKQDSSITCQRNISRNEC